MANTSVSPPLTTKESAFLSDPKVFQMMIDNAPDPIIIIKDRKVIYGNKRATEMTGYTAEEFAGTSLSKFVAKEDRTKVLKRYVARMAGLKVKSIYEVKIVSKDGRRIIPSEINAQKLEYNGESFNFVIFRDITDRNIAKAEQKKEKDEVERLNKVLIGRELKMVELKKELEKLKKASA